MNWIFKFINLFKFKPSSNDDHNIRGVYYNLLLLIGFTTVIILVSFYLSFKEDGYFQVFTILAVIAAYYLAGCAVGFIFAIPKSAQGARQERMPHNVKESRLNTGDYYNDNTSLEEISDWLVKIIIGIGLTQFSYLKSMVESAARSIAAIFPCLPQAQGCEAFFVFSYAIIIFYSIGGIIIGYLWTRIDFPKILTKSKRDVALIEKLEKQNKTILSMINDPGSPVGTKELSQSDSADDPALLELVYRILEKKPALSSSDVQKGRWGGKSMAKGYQLSASVKNASISELYQVTITIRTGYGKTFPSPVIVLLPDVFKPQVRLLQAEGQSEVFLTVLARDAFTVAALVEVKSEQEYTSLELDLNQVPLLPEGFYW